MKLLTNRQVLAMLTPECRSWQICLDDKKAIWRACNENDGSKYVALFNLSEEEAELTVSLAEAGMGLTVSHAEVEMKDVCLTELWTGEEASVTEGVLHAKIPAHGCVVYGKV